MPHTEKTLTIPINDKSSLIVRIVSGTSSRVEFVFKDCSETAAAVTGFSEAKEVLNFLENNLPGERRYKSTPLFPSVAINDTKNDLSFGCL